MGPKECSGLNKIFFLVLVRLRLEFYEEDIAVRVGLSQSQISRVMISWIDFLHARLRSYPIWPSRSSLRVDVPSPRGKTGGRKRLRKAGTNRVI